MTKSKKAVGIEARRSSPKPQSTWVTLESELWWSSYAVGNKTLLTTERGPFLPLRLKWNRSKVLATITIRLDGATKLFDPKMFSSEKHGGKPLTNRGA